MLSNVTKILAILHGFVTDASIRADLTKVVSDIVALLNLGHPADVTAAAATPGTVPPAV